MPTRFADIAVESEQAMSIKYNTMVYELQRLGKRVRILSLGEAFFDVPLFPFEPLPFPGLYHYSNSRGIPELRQKLSEFFLARYDIPINYEREILITAGSKAAIHFAFMATLNPGDEVIIPEPYWVSYPEQVKLCRGVPVCVPMGKTVAELEGYVTPKTRVIVINQPNNPSGHLYSEHELRTLLALVKKYDLWLFSDEAYSEFVAGEPFISPARIDRDKQHTVVFNSISKNYGISGWRLGYVVANEKLIYQILKINQHLITCPSTVLEHYVDRYFTAILKHTEPQIRALMERRGVVRRYLDAIGLKAVPGDATFYFLVSIDPSRLSSEEFATRLLHEYQVSVVPGLGYGKSCDRYIRISIGAEPIEEIKAALEIIKQLIVDTSPARPDKGGEVLVVAGGLWQVPLTNFLKAKGHRVAVVDPYLHSPCVPLSDRHIQCDVRDVDSIQALVKGGRFSAVVTDQSDVSVNAVAKLSQDLGLPGNAPEVTNRFVNKVLMREHATACGIPCPRFARVNHLHELQAFVKDVGLPVIIKPADAQSSRGVNKIDKENVDQLESLFVQSLKFSSCGYVIAEQFIDGREVTVEGFAAGFRHRTLAVSLKRHFRTGIASELRYPAALPEGVLASLERYADLFVERSGLRFGITHAEFMVQPESGNVFLVEIACRGGGTLISSDIVPWVSGVNVYENLYECLFGREPDVKALRVSRRPAILKFFEFKPGVVKAISGIEALRANPAVVRAEMLFKPRDTLKPAEDDRSRQGFFIAKATTDEELDALISWADRTVTVSYA